MAKTILFALLLLSVSVCQTWAAPPEPAVPAVAPLNDDAYERARQKLREQLQSLGQSIDAPAPSSAAAVAPSTGPSSSNATAVVASVSRIAAAAASDLPEMMRGLDDRQKLAVGDRVSYRVVEDREDAKALAVTDSGEVEVPYLGRYKALDKTCYQLAVELKAALEKDFYRRASVVINLDAMSRSRGKVYVFGHVRAPGTVEIPGDEVLTVSKLILRVGGFAEFANKKEVKLTRKSDTGEKGGTYIINVLDILEKGKGDTDMPVKPDDMIFVPARLINF